MGQDTDIIALVGAGDQGLAILKALLGVPGVEVRYVFDADPAAPGVALARENGIRCRTDGRFDELTGDAEVDLDPRDRRRRGRPRGARRRASTRTAACSAPPARASSLTCSPRSTRRRPSAPNVEKARYLRQASHQVKSPLSSIQSYVNVILGGYTGEIPERTRDIVEKIHSRCDAALGALAKRRMLADLRCIDRDGLEMSTVRLGEVIDEAVARHAEAAAGRDIEIRVLPHDGPDLVRLRPARRCSRCSPSSSRTR